MAFCCYFRGLSDQGSRALNENEDSQGPNKDVTGRSQRPNAIVDAIEEGEETRVRVQVYKSETEIACLGD